MLQGIMRQHDSSTLGKGKVSYRYIEKCSKLWTTLFSQKIYAT